MSGKAKGAKTCVRGHTFLFRTLTPPLFLSSFRDFVFGLGPWSWVVLKDKITVLGPGLGLEPSVLGQTFCVNFLSWMLFSFTLHFS